jgi:hypothetical protein
MLAAVLLACGQNGLPGPPLAPSAIAQTGDVVFADDFESGSLASWPDGVDPALHRVVRDPGGAASGSHYLAVKFPEGRDGGWLTSFFMPGYAALHVSYQVRFPGGWRGSPKLIGFYGSRIDNQWSGLGKAGRCPDGGDFFAAMLVAEPTGDPGATRFYTYYPDMRREPDGRTCWGRYGDGSEQYVSLAPLTPGRWHHIEFAVQLNTPGERNARQTFWINGEQRGSWSGFSFGDTRVLKLNAVQLTFSVTGGVPRDQELFVDNLVVRAIGS